MSERSGITEAHTMQCMEIWGGNKAVQNAIATPGLDLWIFSEPHGADVHGGDVHYVTLCGGGIITRLIVADVSGHGESVSEFSHALRKLMRRNINRKSQKGLVRALNRQFTELAQLRRFATAVVATYLATTDRLAVCNAAHPRPLIYRAAEARWAILKHEPDESAMNLPLGIDEESTYDQFTVKLEKGDFVIFYTDALTEAMNTSGEMLGEQGLLDLIHGLDLVEPNRLGPVLLEKIRGYRDGGQADDDVTLVILHHNGGPPHRLSLGEKLDVYAKVFGLKSV
ncbi:PP2C family protein-serine/threonine phosphatase [Tundrisphaera lichenicola]|uniref:PP2C family protein-serine/threonine phosphatase n=1 Tax=Tundrisphaera lichenicola TaxID=2029860 RepID=UPI003EC0DDB0